VPNLSAKRAPIAGHFAPSPWRGAPYIGHMDSWARPLLFLFLLAFAGAGRADAPDHSVLQQARAFVQQSAAGGQALRVDVQVGTLDSRLRLAPCEQIEPYLPPRTRLWGRSRIGLRCLRGPSRWNVYLPVTVRVFGPALVATRALPVGSVIAPGDLAQAEVDLAEDASNALRDAEIAVGRTLARAIDAGRSLRQAHLQPRQWFAAGETVQVVAQGDGFAVSGEAQALTPGIEGRPARVRTDRGRVLSGYPAGQRRLDVNL
jgi:flagella basal body P-ring formation protein FlgA